MSEHLNRTALHGTHTSLKARMVPFAGWDMPVQYTGILAETSAVRSNAGLFDVSHMGRLDISGADSPAFLDWIVTHNAASLRQGRARYALICNEDGGIIDDTVYYRVAEDQYLLVCNASNRQHVVPWMNRWIAEKFPRVSVKDRTEGTAMIAFQGPATPGLLAVAGDVDTSRMRFFSYAEGNVASRPAFVGRTGYTGEDGFELIVDAGDASHVWRTLMEAGAAPCGLGARDVLRLEAGLSLHGNDIDTTTTPVEACLERFVRLDKEFVGGDVLRKQNEQGPARRLVGLNVQGRSLARHGYPILHQGSQVGTVTSGTRSPTLDRVVAMGYVFSALAGAGSVLQIDIRGRLAEAEVVPLPFYTRDMDR